MQFEDDISVGEISDDELQHQLDAELGLNYRPVAAPSIDSSKNLSLGLAISLILHLAIAAIFVRVSMGTWELLAIPDVPIQIQLIPAIPVPIPEELALEEPEEEQEPEQVVEQLATEVVETEPAQEVDQETEPQIEDETRPEELSEQLAVEELAQQEPVSEPPLSEEQVAVESINDTTAPSVLPSVLAIQQSIDLIQTENASKFYSYECNQLEREQGLRDCEPQDNWDYSVLDEDPIYDFHNPYVELTRSQATAITISRGSKDLAARLAASGLPASLSAYVMEEVEAGITHNTTTGNRTVDHMNAMVDRSAAGEQARRLNDPWVQQQTKMLRARKRYTKQELDEMARCGMPQALILPPAEFVKCLKVGENPALIFNLFRFSLL